MATLLHLDCLTVNGKTVGENLAAARVRNPEVIRSLDRPLQSEGGTAVLYGNLCPRGTVIKQSAASPHLEVQPDYVLVLKNAGPGGGPEMPEWDRWPCQGNCSAQGCATWCAFPTRA